MILDAQSFIFALLSTTKGTPPEYTDCQCDNDVCVAVQFVADVDEYSSETSDMPVKVDTVAYGAPGDGSATVMEGTPKGSAVSGCPSASAKLAFFAISSFAIAVAAAGMLADF